MHSNKRYITSTKRKHGVLFSKKNLVYNEWNILTS